MTSAVPAATDALVAAAESLLFGVIVSDGPPDAFQPGTHLTIGADSELFAEQSVTMTAATSTAEQAGFACGRAPRDETTDLHLVAWCWDDTTKAARDEVYRVSDALLDHVRDTPSLGLAGMTFTDAGASRDLRYASPGAGGVIAILPFRIRIQARI